MTSPSTSSEKPSKVIASSRLEIQWDPKYAPPLLRLPEDVKPKTKFDFSSVRKVPFAFQIFQEEAEQPHLYNPHDAFEDEPEPTESNFPEAFDEMRYHELRKKIPYVKFIPYIFKTEEPPLRNPDQFAGSEKVLDLDSAMKANPQTITYMSIMDSSLDSKIVKNNLPKTIANFPRLEVLVLRSINLKKIGDYKLPTKLKFLDVSKNQVSDLKAVLKLVLKLPFLEILNLSDNPIATKSNFREKIIASNSNMTLRVLNGTEVSIEERIRSFLTQGSKSVKQDISPIRWDLYMASAAQVVELRMKNQSWSPSYITKLELKNANLTIFHVGDLLNLEHLDLSNNKLSNIRGNGLEQCEKLKWLSLANNLISKRENLKCFYFTPALKYLYLEGNEGLGNYRSFVVALTRHLKGNNRTPGLLQLDGRNIHVDERIESIAEHADNKKDREKETLDAMRYQLCLAAYYGRAQMRQKEFLDKIRHLRIQRANLSMFWLKSFPSLEVVDLSNNNLRLVEGIETLTRLKYLNLFGNPKLALKDLFNRLARINSLEQVLLGVDKQDHKHWLKNPKYRFKVLSKLLFINPNLRFLDGVFITLDERVETYRLLGVSSEKVDHYRFQLALTINCTLAAARRLHFTEVDIGNQYDPAIITSLRRMNNVGLTNAPAISFSAFKNLEELNLSGNKLQTIAKMGLEDLKSLRILDVSKNQIDVSLKDLGALINKFPVLEIIALRENPSMRNMADRLALIGCIPKLRDATAVLRVIDTEISVDERVEAWKKQGGSKEEVELMRSKALYFLRTPANAVAAQLTGLDLSYGGLSHISLSDFLNLEFLSLKHNYIKSINDLDGIQLLAKLKMLDLRKNLLAKLEEIPPLIQKLPQLKSIGLKGNKFCESKTWRQKLIGSLPDLHETQTELRLIDEFPITVLEIARGWKVSSEASHDRVRMQILNLIKIPHGFKAAEITEFDCSEAELTLTDCDFSEFPNLRKLSLKNNSIKSIENAGIENLTQLVALDLSMNKIKEFGQVQTVVNRLKKLEMIFLDENPCWAQDKEKDQDPKYRVKFLSGIHCMDGLGAKLTHLNGTPIRINERCSALLDAKVYSEDSIEKFRAQLVWEKSNPQTHDQILVLSHIGIRFGKEMSSKLLTFMDLRVLELSYNNMKNVNELRSVLESCKRLYFLDIRFNLFDCSMKDLMSVLKATLPALRRLYIEKAGASKDFYKPPKEYAGFVFTCLPSLEIVDNILNPMNQFFENRPLPSVFEMFSNKRESKPEKTEGKPQQQSAPQQPQMPMMPMSPSADFPQEKIEPLEGFRPYRNPSFSFSEFAVQPFVPAYSSYDVQFQYGGPASPPPPGYEDSSKHQSMSPQSPKEDHGMTTGALYPDLKDYLPQDYHETVGRKYDWTFLKTQLQQQKEEDHENEKDED